MTEIITVVIIAGVLASLVLPRYTGTIERARSEEGVQILLTLLSAQMAYEFDTGSYSDDITLLDVEIPAPKNFAVPVVDDVDPIASITRTGGYRLDITAAGVISCANVGAIACATAGY